MDELAKVIRMAIGEFIIYDGDARLAARAVLAAGYAKRSDTIEECARNLDALADPKYAHDLESVEHKYIWVGGIRYAASALRESKP